MAHEARAAGHDVWVSVKQWTAKPPAIGRLERVEQTFTPEGDAAADLAPLVAATSVADLAPVAEELPTRRRVPQPRCHVGCRA